MTTTTFQRHKKNCKFQFSVEIKYFDRVSFFSLHSSRASNTIPNRRAKAYKQRDGKKRLLSNIYIFRIHTLNSQNLIKIGIGMLRYLNLTAICTSCKAKSRKLKYLMLKIESSSEFSFFEWRWPQAKSYFKINLYDERTKRPITRRRMIWIKIM